MNPLISLEIRKVQVTGKSLCRKDPPKLRAISARDSYDAHLKVIKKTISDQSLALDAHIAFLRTLSSDFPDLCFTLVQRYPYEATVYDHFYKGAHLEQVEQRQVPKLPRGWLKEAQK